MNIYEAEQELSDALALSEREREVVMDVLDRLCTSERAIVRDKVLELWDGNNAWIPGGDYARLAAALNVPASRTLTYRDGGESRPSVKEHA